MSKETKIQERASVECYCWGKFLFVHLLAKRDTVVFIVLKLSLTLCRIAFGFLNKEIFAQWQWFDFCCFGLVKFYKDGM